MARQQVVLRLTAAQALRCEKLGEHLWPTEKLSVGEISRRLLLEHLLWAESERKMVQPVRRGVEEGHCRGWFQGRLRLGRGVEPSTDHGRLWYAEKVALRAVHKLIPNSID